MPQRFDLSGKIFAYIQLHEADDLLLYTSIKCSTIRKAWYMFRLNPSPPSSGPAVYYRKAPGVPVYYLVDADSNLIESIKDWQDQAKAIDQYGYFEDFAQDIWEGFEPITAQLYRTVRAYVVAVMDQPRGCSDRQPAPEPAHAEVNRSATS